MIDAAFYDLLASLPETAGLIERRVTAYKFIQKGVYPALCYNTRDVQGIGCRGYSDAWQGTVEIGVLTNTASEMAELYDTLAKCLSRYEGVHGNYALTLDPSSSDFTESEPAITGFYKALMFDFTMATKLD